MMVLVEAARSADCPFDIVMVASDQPDAAGIAWARDQGLATFTQSPKGIAKAEYEDAIDTALRSAGVEVIALAGYMRLLTGAFVGRWQGRILNIHPSLLPAYKGLDTHARAIAAGETESGASVHIVTEALDAGDVLGQARVAILPGDTPETLAARILTQEHRLYRQVLADFCTR